MSAAAPLPRLPEPWGTWIDRTHAIDFTFEGQGHHGFAGDTVASALAGDGVSVLSRSFKYRRPRGIHSMAGHDANAMVQIGDEPNVHAERRALAAGLAVEAQNINGSLGFDRGAWIGAFGRFLPVGFYYKAFYRPRGAWRFWEPVFRKRAGLGKVNLDAPHLYYDKQYLFADVAIVGGGPAGLAAAVEAASGGLEVVLIEEEAHMGGSLSFARLDGEGTRGRRLAADLVEAVQAATNVRVMTNAVANGAFADNWLPVIQGNRLYKLRAKQLVVATGAIEQPMVFRNNDLPGIMLGSAAQKLMRRYGVQPGTRAVVCTANAHGYGVACDLADAGVDVAAVVDLRGDAKGDAQVAAAQARGIRQVLGHTVHEAVGKARVRGVTVRPVTGEGTVGAEALHLDCDLVCTATGWAPHAALINHGGGRMIYDDALHMASIAKLPDGISAAGSVAGAFSVEAAIAQGRRAGWQAATACGAAWGPEPARPNDLGNHGVTHPWPIFTHPKGKEFVDLDEDLVIGDLVNGVADGFDEIELLKRYSTVGMGPSQGRHSGVSAIRLTAKATGRKPSEIGATTQRPPYRAEKFAHLAGRAFEPVRLTAMHARHLELGAQMMPAGLWLRPAYYGAKDGRDAAIAAEVSAVREGVGLIDVSTLGGIDLRGPDAAEMVERMYTWAYRKQPVGRARYLLMCDQTGAIIDDGVAARLHENHFYLTATTSGVDRVFQLMQFWNAQWRLDVDIAGVTSAFCGVNIAGPKSRQVLARITEGVDLSPAAFPYMGVREGRIAGIPCRLMRVGFVGELGFEIHAPAGCGEALWDALMAAGAADGIRPFGVEAQRVLRLEKGHVIVGQDTDGLTHPYEADMGWAIAKKKPFWLGSRAVEAQMKRGLSRKLVGFELVDPGAPCPEECHLVIDGDEIEGRVTSAVRSATLGKVIGLAYVGPKHFDLGAIFTIRTGAGFLQARVVPHPFYDPENRRQEL
ncbi:2Fe-2S iron-sulfur cluster-binding protein [Zavarzinia sp. CC-PAN008]|uniref:2Fe-2S iron-sulfur cluster-binding protein n=1 Tax=Zavarzinia sp. CC-PAN008 TaxID=3243332 RepID=UPI003F744091